MKKHRQRSYNYVYKVQKGQVTIANGATASLNAINFTLDDLHNVGELTALYDEYRINKIIVELIPRGSPLSQGTVSANGQQYLNQYLPFLTAIDLNDTNAITRAEMYEMGLCKHHRPLTTVKRTIYPKIAIQNYISAVSTGYSSKGKQWIDTIDPNVPHYGFRWSWQQSLAQALGDQVLYDIACTYYVSFRNTK